MNMPTQLCHATCHNPGMAKSAAQRKQEQRARERAAKGLLAPMQQPGQCQVCQAQFHGRVGQQWCSVRCRQRAKRLGPDCLGSDLVQMKVAALERARLGVAGLSPDQVAMAREWDLHVVRKMQREADARFLAGMNLKAEMQAIQWLSQQGLEVEQWKVEQGVVAEGAELWGAVRKWLKQEGLWEEEEA